MSIISVYNVELDIELVLVLVLPVRWLAKGDILYLRKYQFGSWCTVCYAPIRLQKLEPVLVNTVKASFTYQNVIVIIFLCQKCISKSISQITSLDLCEKDYSTFYEGQGVLHPSLPPPSLHSLFYFTPVMILNYNPHFPYFSLSVPQPLYLHISIPLSTLPSMDYLFLGRCLVLISWFAQKAQLILMLS